MRWEVWRATRDGKERDIIVPKKFLQSIRRYGMSFPIWLGGWRSDYTKIYYHSDIDSYPEVNKRRKK